jgi:hypothetical protein
VEVPVVSLRGGFLLGNPSQGLRDVRDAPSVRSGSIKPTILLTILATPEVLKPTTLLVDSGTPALYTDGGGCQSHEMASALSPCWKLALGSSSSDAFYLLDASLERGEIELGPRNDMHFFLDPLLPRKVCPCVVVIWTGTYLWLCSVQIICVIGRCG